MEDTELFLMALDSGLLNDTHNAALQREQVDLANRGLNKSLWEIACGRNLINIEQARALNRELAKKDHQTRRIAGNRVIKRIGRGGMGEVFLGESPDHTSIAIKLLPEVSKKSHDAVARFEREAHTILKLNHPHIVRGLSKGIDKGTPYLVMENIDGLSVKERIAAKQLFNPSDALSLLVQMALGLRYAWRNGILHRDVKPGNILLALPRPGYSEPFCAKLCDFGLAQTHAVVTEESSPEHLSLPGTVLGTPLYMSPEQAEGSADLDQRADIYSLAATIYHAVTGQPVQKTDNLNSLLWKRAHEDINLILLDGRGFSAGFISLLGAMLTRQRSQRIQDWDWVLHACRKLDPDIIDPLLANQSTLSIQRQISESTDNHRAYTEITSSRIGNLSDCLDLRLNCLEDQQKDPLDATAVANIRREVRYIRALAQNLEALSQDRPAEKNQ